MASETRTVAWVAGAGGRGVKGVRGRGGGWETFFGAQTGDLNFMAEEVRVLEDSARWRPKRLQNVCS